MGKPVVLGIDLADIECLGEYTADGLEMVIVRVNGAKMYGTKIVDQEGGWVNIHVPSLYQTFSYPMVNA